jgi:hypothetical protein
VALLVLGGDEGTVDVRSVEAQVGTGHAGFEAINGATA